MSDITKEVMIGEHTYRIGQLGVTKALPMSAKIIQRLGPGIKKAILGIIAQSGKEKSVQALQGKGSGFDDRAHAAKDVIVDFFDQDASSEQFSGILDGIIEAITAIDDKFIEEFSKVCFLYVQVKKSGDVWLDLKGVVDRQFQGNLKEVYLLLWHFFDFNFAGFFYESFSSKNGTSRTASMLQ